MRVVARDRVFRPRRARWQRALRDVGAVEPYARAAGAVDCVPPQRLLADEREGGLLEKGLCQRCGRALRFRR